MKLRMTWSMVIKMFMLDLFNKNNRRSTKHSAMAEQLTLSGLLIQYFHLEEPVNGEIGINLVERFVVKNAPDDTHGTKTEATMFLILMTTSHDFSQIRQNPNRLNNAFECTKLHRPCYVDGQLITVILVMLIISRVSLVARQKITYHCY